MSSPGRHSVESDSRRWPALIVCLSAGFMTLLDITIVTVALPSMQHSLHLTPADVSWSISGYALTFGLVLVPAGRLGDDYGRRRIFLLGLLLFLVTGVLCGAAPNATWLVVGRLFRGVAAGLLAPQVVGLIQQMFPIRERGKAFGFYGAMVGISTAIGPLLGGVILEVFGLAEGWRYVFYLFVPLNLLALLFGYQVLPKDRRAGQRRALDLVGAALLGLSVLSIMLPLIQASGAPSGHRWWLMGVGIGLLVPFALWENWLGSRGRHPLVDLKLLTIRSYSVGTLVATIFYAGFTGIFLVAALFFQQGLKYSALHAALATAIFAVSSASCAIVSGRVVNRFGRKIVEAGCVAAALGLGIAALLVRDVTATNAVLVLAGPLFLAGCGCGFVIAPNQTLALQEIPRAVGGTAAGVYQTGQRLGTAVGTALAGSLYFGELVRSHGDYHAAAALGLAGSAALVALTPLIGLVDIVRPARPGATETEIGDTALPLASGHGQTSARHEPAAPESAHPQSIPGPG